jgi:two-component system chemotaxis sensor kinase CheA
VITKEQADVMSEKDLQDLPFAAGFSTSEKVTDVSGRGVGLDVVRTKIEELNGSVKMESAKGKGTKFALELPLTLAIIKCLLVYVEKDRYALPVINILRIVDIDRKDIEHIGGSEVFILDAESIPLVRLRDVFELQGRDDDRLTVIIIKRGSEKIGIVVDEIIGLQELIIKSVSKALKSTKGIAGATILGDGYPALVLDTGGLV